MKKFGRIIASMALYVMLFICTACYYSIVNDYTISE